MSIKNKIPIVVLGASVNGLGLVRSLAHQGIKVYWLEHTWTNGFQFSRYAKTLTCPHARQEPIKLLSFLNHLADQADSKIVLFPTSDIFNEFVHLNREALSKKFKFIMPSFELMEKLLSKQSQYELAVKHGIPVPKTLAPVTMDDVQKMSTQLAYPVLIKGLDTVSWRARFGDQKGIQVNNAQEFIGTYKDIFSKGDLSTVAQEIIRGEDTDHYKFCTYINEKGVGLLSFSLQKLRQYPCHFGIGSAVKSEWQAEVIELGRKLFREIDYRGVGSVEFKFDSRDGKWKMIEINPRFWAQHYLAAASGQNFGLVAYWDLVGEKIGAKADFESGIKWVDFESDRASFLGYKKEGRITLREWLKSIYSGKKVWSTWMWDDPMPFLVKTKCGFVLIEKIVNKIFDRGAHASQQAAVKSNAGNVQIKVISDLGEFQSMKEEWNDCLRASGVRNPFLRHEWLISWWKGFGQDKELKILRFEDGGKTVAFAPLMKYKTKFLGFKLNVVGFLTNHWTRMDMIIKGDRDACLAKLCDHIKSSRDVFIFAQMDTLSENFKAFRRILSEKGLSAAYTPKPHAYIELTGSWDEYFNQQSPNFRMDSRRKFKRLEKEGRVSLSRNVKKNGTALNDIKSVSSQSWQGKGDVGVISTDSGEKFYNEIVQEWQPSGKLDISVLKVGETPVSYLVGIKEDNHYFAFDTAYDKNFQKYSPGLIMHNLLLEDLYKEGLKRFDFGFTASYKKRWSEEILPMMDVTVFSKSVKGGILALLYKVKTFYQSKRK